MGTVKKPHTHRAFALAAILLGSAQMHSDLQTWEPTGIRHVITLGRSILQLRCDNYKALMLWGDLFKIVVIQLCKRRKDS